MAMARGFVGLLLLGGRTFHRLGQQHWLFGIIADDSMPNYRGSLARHTGNARAPHRRPCVPWRGRQPRSTPLDAAHLHAIRNASASRRGNPWRLLRCQRSMEVECS